MLHIRSNAEMHGLDGPVRMQYVDVRACTNQVHYVNNLFKPGLAFNVDANHSLIVLYVEINYVCDSICMLYVLLHI